MSENIEKECISCGEKGHHYNECTKVPFFGIVAATFGLNPKPICGMDTIELEQSIKDNLK